MGRRLKLDKDFSVEAWIGKQWLEITVPAGFVTDFASIPRLFWRILPPWGSYNRAAVVHDFLYHTHYTTRAEADLIFLWLMKELDELRDEQEAKQQRKLRRVRRWARKRRRQIMYRAVRWFGGRSWRNGPKK